MSLNQAPPSTPMLPTITQTCCAFLLYFATQALLAPLLMNLFFNPTTENAALWTAWTSLLGLALASFFVILYSNFLSFKRGIGIWNTAPDSVPTRPFFSLLIGACYWPLGICLISIVLAVVHFIHPVPEELPDQVAVQRLKESLLNPPLLLSTLISIVILAPVTEELLFRGFFQRMLLRWFSSGWAIALASLIFAAMHLSAAQGLSNIDIFVALFTLSLLLGLLYKMHYHLLTSIGLHITFNAVNVAALVYNASKATSLVEILFF